MWLSGFCSNFSRLDIICKKNDKIPGIITIFDELTVTEIMVIIHAKKVVSLVEKSEEQKVSKERKQYILILG